MLTNVWRRGRTAAVIGVCTAGVLAGAALSAGTATAQTHETRAHETRAHETRAHETRAHTPQARASQAQARVPWSSVGPGWELVQYSSGSSAHLATLYLIAPNGTKYALRTTHNEGFSLVGWSGDKTRAMLYSDVPGTVEQLNLMTGKLTSFPMGGQTFPQGYTLPLGLNIFAITNNGPSYTLARYNLAGKLIKALITDKWAVEAVYAPDGAALAVPGPNGLRLVSNAGGVTRALNVPGTDPVLGCTPVRWWSGSAILAECMMSKTNFEPRLWLVPASGAKATALTPQRKGGYDLGDIDAWRLTSGLYLQSLGACGTLEINKQVANGSVTAVNVPGTSNTHNSIITAAGPRLLIDPQNGCQPGAGLLWFNPATHAEQWLFKYSAHAELSVVPFYSTQNAPL